MDSASAMSAAPWSSLDFSAVESLHWRCPSTLRAPTAVTISVNVAPDGLHLRCGCAELLFDRDRREGVLHGLQRVQPSLRRDPFGDDRLGAEACGLRQIDASTC